MTLIATLEETIRMSNPVTETKVECGNRTCGSTLFEIIVKGVHAHVRCADCTRAVMTLDVREQTSQN